MTKFYWAFYYLCVILHCYQFCATCSNADDSFIQAQTGIPKHSFRIQLMTAHAFSCVHVEATGQSFVPRELCLLFLETVSSLTWNSAGRAELAVQEPQSSACLHLSHAVIASGLNIGWHLKKLMCVLGIHSIFTYLLFVIRLSHLRAAYRSLLLSTLIQALFSFFFFFWPLS